MYRKIYELANIEYSNEELGLSNIQSMIDHVMECDIPENYPEWQGLNFPKRERPDKICDLNSDLIELAPKHKFGLVLTPRSIEG